MRQVLRATGIFPRQESTTTVTVMAVHIGETMPYISI